MLILSETRGKFLMPMKRLDWLPPSLGQLKDELGNENQTRWRVTARCHDGAVRWRGWFDDREDADAFMWGVFTGEIVHDRDLWRQPTPNWYPDIDADLLYAVDSVTFKTSPTNTQTLWTSPVDWDNQNNKIEVLGGGASGGCREGSGTPQCAGGGGGGAYSKVTNFTVASPGVTTAYWTVGSGGGAKTSSGTGNSGYDSWFNGTAVSGSTCGAKAGQGGGSNSGGSANGGSGGSYSSGVGSTRYSGGGGGDCNSVTAVAASGGGGAAGTHGVGRDGDNGSGNNATDGGNGDLDYGGGGGSPGNDGGNGTEWDGSHGSGGGGGAEKASSGTMVAGDGGYYGGGGGGSAVASGGSATGGAGRQGLIVITYTPLVPALFTMPISSNFFV